MTRKSKKDYAGAAHDLNGGLGVCRYTIAYHKSGRGQLDLANAPGRSEGRHSGISDQRYKGKADGTDVPSSLEARLLFHGAGILLTLACQSVHTDLDWLACEHEEAETHEATSHSQV